MEDNNENGAEVRGIDSFASAPFYCMILRLIKSLYA